MDKAKAASNSFQFQVSGDRSVVVEISTHNVSLHFTAAMRLDQMKSITASGALLAEMECVGRLESEPPTRGRKDAPADVKTARRREGKAFGEIAYRGLRQASPAAAVAEAGKASTI
jgi:hypothetical protein